MTDDALTDADPRLERRHFPGTIHKRGRDGSEVFSSFLDPGEVLITGDESRKAQHPEQ
jgi:hypothetical protein